MLAVFQKKTGIKVDTHDYSAAMAVLHLDRASVDIASTSRRTNPELWEPRYVVSPFCKAPLAIITHAQCPVDGLTSAQLHDIFVKDISNWKEVGGPDQPILRIVPDKKTAANKNFRRQVMKHEDAASDIITYKSVDTIAITEKLQGAISFIARDAVLDRTGIKVLKIDGLSPDDPDYPYFQVFYLVTKGMPNGPARALADFVFSPDARAFMEKKGMIPMDRAP